MLVGCTPLGTGEIAGSAYLFAQLNGSWDQQRKLVADDGDADGYFGESVAVSSDGTTAIIGADEDDDPNGDGSGAAYSFFTGL